MDCGKKSKFCNNKDLKRVQLRDICSGGDGKKNEFNGAILMACKECRSYMRGTFKMRV
jgi:hypothetical protein